jgi:hypothetical protein
MEVFDDTFVPPGLHDVWTRSLHCPRCVWPHLHRVPSAHQEHFLCDACGHCWCVEHGHLRQVDPLTCQGCAARSKASCITLMQQEFPQFVASELEHATP